MRHGRPDPMRQTAKALIVTMALLIAGCLPRTVTPLVILEYDLAPGEDKLAVFLPGRGENTARINKRGLFEVIGNRGYDVIVADLHLGYYIEGTFLERLRNDNMKKGVHLLTEGDRMKLSPTGF